MNNNSTSITLGGVTDNITLNSSNINDYTITTDKITHSVFSPELSKEYLKTHSQNISSLLFEIIEEL